MKTIDILKIVAIFVLMAMIAFLIIAIIPTLTGCKVVTDINETELPEPYDILSLKVINATEVSFNSLEYDWTINTTHGGNYYIVKSRLGKDKYIFPLETLQWSKEERITK